MNDADSSDQYDQFDSNTRPQEETPAPVVIPRTHSTAQKVKKVARRLLNADEVGDQDYQSEPQEREIDDGFRSVFQKRKERAFKQQ